MTNVLIPVTAGAQTAEATEEATPGCGCCIPPPDASQAEGRQRALDDLQARRDALERRLQDLS